MKVLLALSGGIDSMYMANRASELFPEASFAIAHCNFSLRGEESNGDEEFVQGWAKDAGIPCFVKRFDTLSYASNRGVSTEMAARELRYSWFEELAIEIGAEAIAIAHNANDNAETLLLNLLRGTGSRGLRGISSNRSLGSGIVVLRPLLGITREEIRNYMICNGLSWREDRTNSESFCDRNIIRNDVFPLFSKINPSFIRTLNEDISRFSQIDDIANDYFESCKSELKDEAGNILVEKLLGTKHYEFVLWRLLEASGINSAEFSSLVSCLKAGRQLSGKRFGPVLGSAGRLIVSNSATLSKEPHFACEIIERSCLESLNPGSGALLLDAEKLPLPLKVRKWEDGDWLIPFGMKGRKKVSDLLTNLHYSIDEKKGVQVVEYPKNSSRVAAVLFIRIDDSLKITSSTVKVLKITTL